MEVTYWALHVPVWPNCKSHWCQKGEIENWKLCLFHKFLFDEVQALHGDYMLYIIAHNYNAIFKYTFYVFKVGSLHVFFPMRHFNADFFFGGCTL